MASSVIHIAVASEVNKVLKKEKSKLLLGSIAPDISRFVGKDRSESHFLDNDSDIPNLSRFLNKYGSYLNDDFVLGYFIHLYTDYLWFKYFISEVSDNDFITKLNGEVVRLNGNMKKMYVYNRSVRKLKICISFL